MLKKIKRHAVSCLAFGLAAIGVLGCNDSSSNTETNEDAQTEITDDQDGFEPILDVETMGDWEGDPTYWRLEDGEIVGEVTPATLLKTNTFLIWKGGEPADFELKADFKITEGGNSGINYRSELVEEVPYALRGYQADIDGKNNYTGQNYEERKRTTLAYRGQKTDIQPQEQPGDLSENIEKNAWKGLKVTEQLGDMDSLRSLIKSEDWNTIHLVVDGNNMKHYVNGVLMSEVEDNDPANRNTEGLIGIQVHVGPPMQVRFKNIQLKKL